MTKKTVLSCGVRLIYQQIEHIRSVSAGIWVNCGSKCENESNNGVSHFIEHMMFKGSRARNAAALAHDIEMLGAYMNAFTSKENTCYYLKCLDDDFYPAFDIMSEMVKNPLFDSEAVEQERRVILEEIGMYLDTPEEVASEELTINSFLPHPCARPILGTRETVSKITRDEIAAYYEQHYNAENTVVAVVGSFDEEELIAYMERVFSGMRRGETVKVPNDISFSPCEMFESRDIAQNHLCIGYESVGRDMKLMYTLSIVSVILGDGMSSRLYQRIREQRGLCYSIYTFNSVIYDTGMFTIYAAYNPSSESEIRRRIDEVVNEFAENGATEDEFIRAKKQMITSVIMSFESSSSRMPYIARGELIYGRVLELDELIELVDDITLEEVNALAARILTGERSICIVGEKV